MSYQVFTNSFIAREKLTNEELVRMYFNDSKICLTEDTFEFESDSFEEAHEKFESLQDKPHYDCYNKGYQYVVVILTTENDIEQVHALGFESDNKFKEMISDYDFEEYETEELEKILNFYKINSDNLVENFDDEIEEIKEILSERK